MVRRVVERVHRLLELRDEGRDFVYTQEVAELTGTLTRGLSLHTDIAIFERNAEAPAGMPVFRATGVAVILVDGQQTGFRRRSAHWPIARQIAAELSTRPAERPAGHRVVSRHRRPDAAVGRLRLCWGRTSRAARRCSRTTRCSRCIRARSARLSAIRGSTTTCGSVARPRGWVRPPAASRDGPPPATALRLPKATKIELGIAERELRRALTLDPTLHEARIRLAHVLGAAGRPSAGGEVVRPALEAPLPPFLGVLRGADPRPQRGTARALRRGGCRLRARRRAVPRRAVGRGWPQPRRPGAGAGARRAEDPRRRHRPVLDRAAGSLAGLLEAARA